MVRSCKIGPRCGIGRYSKKGAKKWYNITGHKSTRQCGNKRAIRKTRKSCRKSGNRKKMYARKLLKTKGKRIAKYQKKANKRYQKDRARNKKYQNLANKNFKNNARKASLAAGHRAF